jgi:hypothetical protein
MQDKNQSWKFKWSNTHLNGNQAYVMFYNAHDKLNIIYTLEALEERINSQQTRAVPMHILQEAMNSLYAEQQQAA